MPLDISHAESSYLEGSAQWEKFITRVEGQWFLPLTKTQLALTNLQVQNPRVREVLAQSNPQALVEFEGLMRQIQGE